MRKLPLTRNFRLGEFLISSTYPAMLAGVTLEEAQVAKLHYLCAFGLQKIRDIFGPVHITSGYRTLQLNEAVGGVDTSQHVFAEAADFYCPNAEMGIVFKFLREELKWPGQVIFYRGLGHIHIGLPRIGTVGFYKTQE
jgi:zinc D-Ala-D-Ala carboxypeptidase